MKIRSVRTEELRPYRNNAKIHSDEQIDKIAESIKQFGFINPMLVDNDLNVIAGHGRLEAAKKLKMSEVPCVFVEGLTDEQKKAYILADNRLAEMSDWDENLLREEIASIPDIDMSELGFELPGVEDGPDNEDNGGYYGDYRETTNRQYNLDEFNPMRAAGRFQMPVIEPTNYVPDDLQGFNYVMNRPDPEKGIHFFIDDYQFERIWQRPISLETFRPNI